MVRQPATPLAHWWASLHESDEVREPACYEKGLAHELLLKRNLHVMKANVMISNNYLEISVIWMSEHSVEVLHIIIKICITRPLSFIKEVAWIQKLTCAWCEVLCILGKCSNALNPSWFYMKCVWFYIAPYFFHLRILASYDAKIRPPDTFCPITL